MVAGQAGGMHHSCCHTDGRRFLALFPAGKRKMILQPLAQLVLLVICLGCLGFVNGLLAFFLLYFILCLIPLLIVRLGGIFKKD